MSVPHYYKDGVGASAQMKQDLKRVRAKRPERYVERVAKEQRHSAEGGTVTISVTVPPNASAPSGRQRHEFWTRRPKGER